MADADRPPVVAVFAASASRLAEAERAAAQLKDQAVLPGTSVGALAAEAGFVACVEECRRRFPDADLVLLEPGIAAPYAWDARLAKAAYAAPRIAAASALGERGPMFSLLDAGTGNSPDAALVDRTVYCLGERNYYEVPGLNPSCVYLRRDALDAAMRDPLDGQSPASLARRLRALGWSCVVCDYLYVGRPAETAAAPLADPFEEQAFVQHHPLGALRRALNDGIRQGLPPVSMPALDARPVHLHILHFWGGGLDRWVRDFGTADTAATNMLLATYRIGETGGQRLVLYADPAARIPIRVWDIAQPIRSTATTSVEYRRILDQVIAEFDVEAIVVSSLIGHSLDALTRRVRTLVSCHDYYPVCQAVNPRFGKTCERCTLDDLRECARANPLNRIFTDQSSEEWHAMRGLFTEHLLAGKVEMAVPTPSMVETLRRLDPRLQDVTMHVIAHGTDFNPAKLAYPARASGERLRIAVLGRLSIHKGLELLRESAAEISKVADVTLVGCGKNALELAAASGWKAIERYELAELPEILRSIAPHAGLLPSVVPETFSYTLSELWALGIPPVASALGSFRDRIVEGRDGFLFEPHAAGLAKVLRLLHAQPALLDGVARSLAARGRERSTAEMVADYRMLLPVAERPVARFRVGIGRQTALTEPYRHLEEAYAHLNGAYAETAKAFAQTREAYLQTRGELDGLRSAWNEWFAEFNALQVRRRPWNAWRAVRLVLDIPRRIQSPKDPNAAK